MRDMPVTRGCSRPERLALYLLGLLLCCSANGPRAADYSFDYLYIDAGEGDSSGGHAAIRFGDETYHFQYYGDGLLRAAKEDSRHFEYKYRFLGNRTVFSTRVQVSESTRELLRDRFAQEYLYQNGLYRRLQDARADQRLLRRLMPAGGVSASAAPVDVGAAGLFAIPGSETSTGGGVVRDLRERIAAQLGANFLRRRSSEVRAAIRALQPTDWPATEAFDDERANHAGSYPLSREYRDRVQQLFALQVLEHGTGLEEAVLRRAELSQMRLSPALQRRLAGFQQDLQQNLLELCRSRRPDSGFAVLVGVARLIAVNESLRDGYLVFVDTYPVDAESVSADEVNAHRPVFDVLLRDSFADFQAGLQRFAAGPVDERDYSRLELDANQMLELDHSLRSGGELRKHPGNLVPLGRRAFDPGIRPAMEAGRVATAVARAQAYERALKLKLEADYRYDLIYRNCVVELFRNIHIAMAEDRSERLSESAGSTDDGNDAGVRALSERRLGGYVDPTGLNSIPFVSANAVNSHYRVQAQRTGESYRKQRLQQMYDTEWTPAVYLRESNVFTSTIYRPNPDDSFFVFFTDDQIAFRPLFGAVNSVSGIAQALAGVVTAPLDRGQNLVKGVKGFLVSLPELVFFNMRKGTFRYPPYTRLVATTMSNSMDPGSVSHP